MYNRYTYIYIYIYTCIYIYVCVCVLHIPRVYIDHFFSSVFPGHEAQLAPLGPGGAASLERGHDQGAMGEAMGKPWGTTEIMGFHKGNHSL